MDEIGRARRRTWRMLAMTLGIVWLFVGLRTVLDHLNGQGLAWFRLAPALVATACFTRFYLRAATAAVERRYATRDVVAAGACAVPAAVIGGGDPMYFGMVPAAWLSVAVLNASGRASRLMMAGTMAGCVLLAYGNYFVDPGALLVDDVGPGRVLLFLVPTYVLFCTGLPASNRAWMRMLSLAVQAHQGKEAHTRLALAEERLRFSRDLHDLVGHRLSAIAVKTDLAVRLADADTDAAKAQMIEVNALTRTALRELRQAVRGYRELDLKAELESVRAVLEAAGVRCEVRLPYRDLPEEVAPVFAYVVREAVTNVLKHSSASFCEILLRFTGEEAEVRVRNDGAYRDREEGQGSGLTGLGERVAALGGSLTARPVGEGEFLVSAVVSLPLRG